MNKNNFISKEKNIQKVLLSLILGSLILVSCGRKAKDTDKASSIEPTVTTEKAIDQESIAKLKDAIESNDTSLVETSLSELDEVDYQFKNGETPLTFALKVAKRQIVAKLAAKSKDLNLKNALGETPMIVAAKEQRFYSMNILNLYGADINAVDKQKNTPLIYVVQAKKASLALNLIKNGANVAYQREGQLSILELAEKNKLNEVSSLIRQILNLSNIDINNQFLSTQIKNADIVFVEYLIKNHKTAKEKLKGSNFINTVLSLNEKGRRVTLLRTLLENNIYTKKPDILNNSVITAVKNEMNYELSLLLSKYNGVNTVDPKGRTPLTYAVEYLNYDMVNLLVSHNAQIVYLYSSPLTGKKTVEVNTCSFIPTKRASRRMSFEKRSRREEMIRLLGCNIN